jgi:hypothetical protein
MVSSKSTSSERVVKTLNAVVRKALAPCSLAPYLEPPLEISKSQAAKATVKAKATTKVKAKAKTKAKAKAPATAKVKRGVRVKVEAVPRQRLLRRPILSKYLANSSPVAGVGTRAARIVHTVTLMPSSPHRRSLNLSKKAKAKIRASLPQQFPLLPPSGRGKRTTYARNT